MRRLLPLLVSLSLLGTAGWAASSGRPNIVVLLIDNVGYGDLACYGNTVTRTPAIDRFASEGVRLTNFYSASPNCSPSRAAFLTGRYPQRNGLTDIPKMEGNLGVVLRPGERLLPEFLREAGYATMAVGKWHLGFAPGGRPTERGFDGYFGNASGNIDYFHHLYAGRPDLFEGTEPAQRKGYSTDLYADAAIDFIRRSRARPFFLYLAFNAAHYNTTRNVPPGEPYERWEAPAEVIASYGPGAEHDQVRRHAAVITALDSAIGRVLGELDRLGLRENTLVALWSDNGAEQIPGVPYREGVDLGGASNAPFRGVGSTLWEAGMHLPAVVRWPGHLPAGAVCRAPIFTMDFFVMAIEAARARLPSGLAIDGRDPMPALTGRAGSPHDALYWDFRTMSAMREGNYKIVREKREGPWSLYNLEKDIGETTDLSSREPTRTEQMAKRFVAWQQSFPP